MCCEEMRTALKDPDSGFTVASTGDGLGVRIDLGKSSSITTTTCLWCEKEISQDELKTYLQEAE
ncbi:hypothetical protein HDF10_002233 [Edaphobacter lichenicola]|uniref:Uncharacterized protein n=1 Tax=Tunturiibacter lichenicola TaxID=2051959 RepID=A0A7W8N3K3_9BACT|nr:hypothetical protein [Edaphobacter lichenicola]